MICEQLMLNTFWGQRTVHDDGCSSYRTYAPLCGGARTEPVCTVRCCRKVRARVRADPNEIEQVTLGRLAPLLTRGVWGCNLPLVAAAS